MVLPTIRLVKRDTQPQLRVVLSEETSGDPIDLTGATVTLHVRVMGASAVLFSRAGYVNPATASTGEVIFLWGANDLDIAPGDYEAEVEAYWSATATRQTAFEILRLRVRADFV